MYYKCFPRSDYAEEDWLNVFWAECLLVWAITGIGEFDTVTVEELERVLREAIGGEVRAVLNDQPHAPDEVWLEAFIDSESPTVLAALQGSRWRWLGGTKAVLPMEMGSEWGHDVSDNLRTLQEICRVQEILCNGLGMLVDGTARTALRRIRGEHIG